MLKVTVPKGTMGDLHFVAHFRIKTFTVTYNTDGGSAVAPVTQNWNTALTAPSTTKVGYNFLGWYKDGVAFDFATEKLTEDMTLTAMWDAIEYSITYALDGGYLSNKPTSYTVESAFTLGTPTKSNYEFLGWTYEGQSTPVLTVTVPKGTMGDLHFVAHFRIKTFTVTFKTNGGSAIEPITLAYGSLIPVPVCAKEGYTLQYWTKNGYSAWDFTTNKVTGDITLEAIWKVNSYTVTFDANGGTAVAPVTQSYGTKLAAPVSEREGARLLGWYNGDTPWNFDTDTLMQDMTLVAKWEILYVKVTLNANDGSTPTTFTQDFGTHLTAPEITREGYTLLGWFSGDAPWDFATDTLTENVTLIARWKADEYTITYNLGGATIQNAPKSYTVESEAFTLPHPTLAHHSFLGWTYEGQSMPVLNVTVQKGSMGALEYTATFRPDTYTVSFFTNGGTAVPSITVEYGTKLTAPEVSKTGVDLLGWYNGEELWDFENDIVSANITLTAVWNEDTFKITFIMGDERVVVYTDAGAVPAEPKPTKYNGMTFVSWDRKVNPASENTSYVAIYTDIMSVSNMLEMYEYSASTFANGRNALYATSALYMLALQEYTSPLDGPVRERILEHLRNVVAPGNAPDFDLAPTWDYTSLSAAIAIIRATPTVWKHIDSELEEQIDVLMKGLAYVESFGTSDDNDYRTGPSMRGNYRKSWNPNYRMASIPPMIYTAFYFGDGNMAKGATTLNTMLKAFNEAEYNFMIGKFEEYGWLDALSVWTAEGKVCDDGSSYNGQKGKDAKTLLLYGGMAICDDTPTATTIWVYGGNGKGVTNGGRDYLYGGVGLDNPAGIIEKLISHNYSGGAVKSDHWYEINGTYQQVAWILDRSSSPYEGQMGMMLEFASGNRSSTGYCSHDFYLTTIILSSASALGIYDCKSANPTLFDMVTVGNEDFFYKNEIGYQGYATGSYGTSTSTHSEANENAPYFALKNYWREHMKGSNESTFPILPF